MTTNREGSAATWEVVTARDVKVPMRDGVRLATDLYLPARAGRPSAGPWPALLLRTPYNKAGNAAVGEYYARRGYLFACQDVRGRYASEGEFHAFIGEERDGYDAVEWLAAQDGCDGHVGTLGASYCAAAQSALACLAPPHLGAMAVQFGPSSFFHSSMRHNGALELRFMVYAFSMASTSREAAADAGLRQVLEEASRRVWDYLELGSIRRGATPLALVPHYEQWALDLQNHVLYDEFWRQPGFGPRDHYDGHADVPTLYIGGWYDTYTRGTFENAVAMRRRQRWPVHVVVGPWHHGGAGLREAGDCWFDASAAVDMEALRLRWFDQWLKGLDTGLTTAAPVRWFMMGGPGRPEAPLPRRGLLWRAGSWREAASWPPPECRPTPYYLHGDGRLDEAPPGPDEERCSTYTYDPRQPVPTLGGNLSAMPLAAGGFDQRTDERFTPGRAGVPLASRPDVLVFQTPPLAAPLELAGPVRARLFVSSDAPDTDFTAKLVEVLPASPECPGGAAVNLTESIARLRFREGYDHEAPYSPGQVVELSFELFPTAVRIEPGHALRVDISSSNYPRFDRNRNSAEPLGSGRTWRLANNSLHHSSEYASCIEMPVLPGRGGTS